MSFILLSEQDVKVFKGALIYDVRRGRGLADEVRYNRESRKFSGIKLFPIADKGRVRKQVNIMFK